MNWLQQFLISNFGISPDASATILITLLVFILGYVINGFFKSISSWRERKRIRAVFNAASLEIYKSCEKQAKSLKEHISQFEGIQPKLFSLKKHRILHLDNIQKVDFIQIINSFDKGFENIFNNKNIKLVNAVYKNVALINYYENTIEEDQQKFIQKYNEYNSNRNEYLSTFQVKMENIFIQFNNQKLERNFATYVKKVDDTVVNWQQQKNSVHYSISNEYLVEPLIRHFQSNMDQSISRELIYDLLKADYEHQNIVNLMNAQRDHTRGMYYNYRRASKVVGFCYRKLK